MHQGRLFVLRMSRRWLDSKFQMVARPSSMGRGAETVRLHNFTHCPYQSWFEVSVASKGKSDHYHFEAPQPMDGDVVRIQMDFMLLVQKEHSWMYRERERQFSW